MTDAVRENWLCNIHDAATYVTQEQLDFILSVHGGGAASIEELSPSYFEAVWNELFDNVRD